MKCSNLLFLLSALGLTHMTGSAADAGFAVRESPDRCVITYAGQPVATYVFRDERILRPYFCHVHAPGGIPVTRNHPPVPGKDATDHDTMHPGLWLAFGDINGQDFWRNKGRITEKNGGGIVASTGAKTAKATWGKSFEWCDYSGELDGRRVGVTLMPDPANFGPSWFHNRDYGLMVANPFGRKAMNQGETSRVVVKKGDRLSLRFGIYLHATPSTTETDLPAAYRQFLARKALGSASDAPSDDRFQQRIEAALPFDVECPP